MSLQRYTINLFTLVLSVSLLAIGYANVARGEPDNTNLLSGDPGFEIGMAGWHAYAGPWRSTDLSNKHYPIRYKEDNASGPDASIAYAGKQSARVAMRPDARAYLTATSPTTLDSGSYTFSGYARCSVPTKIQLRILNGANEKTSARNYYSATAQNTAQVGSNWTQVALPFQMASRNTVVPIIDVQGGKGSCWFDALMLNRGSTAQPYAPPGNFVASLSPEGPFPTPMPGLLLTQRPAGVTAKLSLRLYSDTDTGPYTVTVQTQAPEGQRNGVSVQTQDPAGQGKQVSTLEIQGKAGEARSTLFSVNLPHTGIWKIIVTIRDASGQTTEAETVVATMTPHAGPIDSFFGTQQKLSPLVAPMGFGAVRDMHLLHWNDVMPAPDKWVAPDPAEIKDIRAFVENGGIYLATLVSENPAKVGYIASHWGKPDYGGIPQWAQDGRDTSPGALGQVTRAIKPEALATYAAEAAQRYPFLAFEVMNEPLHYLKPHDYAILLKTAYTAIKKTAPNATVVGMANPPSWFKLPGGKDAGLSGPAPFDWFEQVLSEDGGNFMDIIGIHPYDRGHKSEVPENGYIPSGQAGWARELRNLAEKRTPKRKLPVWVTEKGITSPSWRTARNFTSDSINARVKSALTQARWIVRSQVDMRSHGVEHFFLWNQLWSTSSTHRFYPFEDSRYTMFDADGLPRPDLIAQKVLIENLSGVQPVAEGQFKKGTRYALFRSDKHLVAVLWAYGKDEAAELAGRAAQSISCPTLPAATAQINLFGDTKSYTCTGQLTLTPSPIYIRSTDPNQAKAWKQALESIK